MIYLIENPYIDGARSCRFKPICYEVSNCVPNSSYASANSYGKVELTGVTYKLVNNKLVKGKTTMTSIRTWISMGNTLFDTPEAAIDEKLVRTARAISTFTKEARHKINVYQSALDRNTALLTEITANRPELLL